MERFERTGAGFVRVIAILLAAFGLVACVQPAPRDETILRKAEAPMALPAPKKYTHVLESSYGAADNLAAWLHVRGMDPKQPILAASFVNVDNLTKSSTLGRIISEQIASRLAQHGFKVIETKLRRDSIFIQKDKGEFLLSRELMDLGASYQAYAVLVGTYAVSDTSILISARMVRTQDSSVIAGYDYELTQNDAIRSML